MQAITEHSVQPIGIMIVMNRRHMTEMNEVDFKVQKLKNAHFQCFGYGKTISGMI